MSDRFAAEIFIGGELSEKMLPDFIETIENEVGQFKGLDENTTPKEFMDIIGNAVNSDNNMEVLDTDGSLRFFVSEASWGRFEDLETFCKMNNLSYTRESGSYYEYNAEIEWWQPGMEKPRIVPCDNQNTVTIGVGYVRKMIEDIKSFNVEDAPLYLNEKPGRSTTNQEFLAKWSLQNDWNPIEALKAYLDDQAPEPPDSPGEFKIISDS